MGNLLLILWLGLIAGMVTSSIFAVKNRFSVAAPAKEFWLTSSLLAICVFPTSVFLITSLFLFNSNPTVQFNAGSDSAMNWWSCWVKWWPTIGFVSLTQIPVFLLLAITSLIWKPARGLFITLIFAFAAAIIGSFVLGLASPRA